MPSYPPSTLSIICNFRYNEMRTILILLPWVAQKGVRVRMLSMPCVDLRFYRMIFMRQSLLSEIRQDPECITLTQKSVSDVLDSFGKLLRANKPGLSTPWQDFFSAMLGVQVKLKEVFGGVLVSNKTRLEAKKCIDEQYLPCVQGILLQLSASMAESVYLSGMLKHLVAFQQIHYGKDFRQKRGELAWWEKQVFSEIQKLGLDFGMIAGFVDPLIVSLTDKYIEARQSASDRREVAVQTDPQANSWSIGGLAAFWPFSTHVSAQPVVLSVEPSLGVKK